MRARNREINIFNMSLLDILTGMLGAFLFLMLGMLPYYAKVMEGKLANPEDLKRLEELETENKSLRDQIAQLQNQLQNANQGDVAQLKQRQEQLEKERDELEQDLSRERSYAWRITVSVYWGSSAADIDAFLMYPDGEWVGPKAQFLAGTKIYTSQALDSHGDTKNPATWEVLNAHSTVGGDFLLVYRTGKNAKIENYSQLWGQAVLTKQALPISATFLPPANAINTKPGGIYAWAKIRFDPTKTPNMTVSPPDGKLPRGVLPLPKAPGGL